jgi:hypothetical protein
MAKLLWKSVLSIPGAKYMCLDIEKLLPFHPTQQIQINVNTFCPVSPVDCQTICPEGQSCQWTHLGQNVPCHVGPSPSWNLDQQAPQKMTRPHGYFKCKQTSCLWKHETHPISFTLVMDNFGMKYLHEEDIAHLIRCIKEKYELTKDWDGNLYCGICLNWGYVTRMLDISMPG